jgi:hypothetical protein
MLCCTRTRWPVGPVKGSRRVCCIGGVREPARAPSVGIGHAKTRSGHPSRVTIPHDSQAGRQSGLLSDSVVMTDNLATIVESALDDVIGNIPMVDIDRALRHTLALNG